MMYIELFESRTKNLNDAFWKWFGDSKVIRKNKPLKVYHGSSRIFTEFDAIKSSVDFPEAMYFSSSKKTAESYSNKGVPIYNLYLRIEKPFYINAYNKDFNTIYDKIASEMHFAKDNGYDGLIIMNIKDDWSQKGGGIAATTYITFEPNQIKSVDNDGSWNIDVNNIYS